MQYLSILLLPSAEEWCRIVRTSVMCCVLFHSEFICEVLIQSNGWSWEELSCWKSSLVLSIPALIFSQLYKRQSSISESPTVWLCWCSFSCIFFLLFESLERWLVSMSISFWGYIIQGQLLCENLLSFELSYSCLFQYFICLGFSCSWCWLGLPFWVWRKLSMLIWEALLMPFKTFPD